MIALCCLLLFVSACGQVAITGRKQLNLIPDSVMNSMSFQSYGEFLSESKLSSDVQQTEMVKRVGHRIQIAVSEIDKLNGQIGRFVANQLL